MKLQDFSRLSAPVLMIGPWLLLSPASALAGIDKDSFKASHDSLFTKESVAITFRVKVIPDAEGKTPDVSLLQVDDQGNKLRYIGIMSDDGVMGDRKAGDGIFSKKINLTEKKAGNVYFAAVEDRASDVSLETGTPSPEVINRYPHVKIEVLRRPSFIEAMGRVWNRILGREPESNS